MKNHTTTLYTLHTRMSELIDADYNLLLLFPRFGMELGVGDRSVAEHCNLYGTSPQLFVMMCNIYTHADYRPTDTELQQLDIPQLLGYLSRSHAYYANSRIKLIEEQLCAISQHHSPAHSAVLQRFFAEYKQEVIHHFAYEEDTVFPYIRSLIDNRSRQQGYDIDIFKHNHSNIDYKLCDLKHIIAKHLPGIGLINETTELLFQIFLLEEDLSRHTFIEDVVLIPLVQQLENSIYGK